MPCRFTPVFACTKQTLSNAIGYSGSRNEEKIDHIRQEERQRERLHEASRKNTEQIKKQFRIVVHKQYGFLNLYALPLSLSFQ